jgi:type IV pilus assembly protein PilP
MRLGKTLVVASLLAAAGSGLYAQTKTPPTPPPAKTGTAKAAAKTSSKTAAPKATSGTAAAAPAESEQKVARRDPFESLTTRQDAAAKNAANLPPGKPGLQIGTLRLDGIVKAPNGMIAVVTNPQARTYFLRDGDQLYDGRVEKIGMDSVSFHEIGKDAFGKPVERQVNKRIYSSAGEQQ